LIEIYSLHQFKVIQWIKSTEIQLSGLDNINLKEEKQPIIDLTSNSKVRLTMLNI